jgi:hypothetical protein
VDGVLVEALEFMEESDLQIVASQGGAGLANEMDPRREHDADPDFREDDRKRQEVMPMWESNATARLLPTSKPEAKYSIVTAAMARLLLHWR